jgi:hypothetical protein
MERLLSQFHAWLVAGGPDVLYFEPAVTVLHARAFVRFLAAHEVDSLAAISDGDECERWLHRYTIDLQNRNELRDRELLHTSVRLFAGFITMPGAALDALEAENETATPDPTRRRPLDS